MNVTAATQDMRGTTVKWTSLSVPLIPASMLPHVSRGSKDTPASAGQVLNNMLHAKHFCTITQIYKGCELS